MKAIDRAYTQLINGSTQFIIPVFQRDYAWTDAQCRDLWNDVIAAGASEESRGHFLGSIVYVSTKDSAAGFTRWLLIDGQQRVTTLALLFTALRDHIRESKWASTGDGPTVKRIDAYFLKNEHEEGDRVHKLRLRRRDDATLRALVDGSTLPPDASDAIRDNYDFFRERLAETDPAIVYRGISRLVVVDVTLDATADDPQLVFESLNSTGVDLSQADLIRNYVLMRHAEPEQTRLYQQYWSRIEESFRGSERAFDNFIRDFIARETRATKQEKADQVYIAFRRVFADMVKSHGGIDAFLERLRRSAGYHAAFSANRGVAGPAGDIMRRIHAQADVPAILIMRLQELHAEAKTLSDSEFVQALTLIESYLFRRAIAGEQTRGYWQVFSSLTNQLEGDKPLESLKISVACLTDSYRFPSDDDFRRVLEERDIYTRRVAFDLLERLENHDQKEPSDTQDYTIEHILPQNERLRKEWRDMLGPDWQDIQRQWVHRLGNLTLTAYNTTYSDRSFDDKKRVKGGFEDSAVRLNRFVREQAKWTQVEIERRGKALAANALKIWPPLEVEATAVQASRERELRRRSQEEPPDSVVMTEEARALFDPLQKVVLGLSPQVIAVGEGKSVTFHDPEFFLEVLPRRRRLDLLCEIDFAEVQDPAGVAQDAKRWKFMVNAKYEGGTVVSIRELDDIPHALAIVAQARQRTS